MTGTTKIFNKKRKGSISLGFSGGLFERAVGLIDLVISGLLGFGELESLEIVESGARPAGNDALVKSIFLPLLVDLGRGPRFTDGAGAGSVRDGDLVLKETQVLELHGLARDTYRGKAGRDRG